MRIKFIEKLVGLSGAATTAREREVINLDQEVERIVYTYRACVLPRVSDGDEFTATICSDCVVTSDLTGASVDTSDGSALPLAFSGKPFGVVFVRPDSVIAMRDSGVELHVRVKCVGKYDENIPELIVYLPRK